MISKVVLGILIYSIFFAILGLFIRSSKSIEMSSELAYLTFMSLIPLAVSLLTSFLMDISKKKLPIKKIVLSERKVSIVFFLGIFLILIGIILYNPLALFDEELRRLARYESKIALLTPLGHAFIYFSLAITKKNSNKFMIIASSIALLMFSRSMLLILIIIFLSRKVLSSNRNISLKLIIYGVLAIFFIAFLGTLREESSFSMIVYSGFDVGSESLAWIFSYTLINFDNLYLAYLMNLNNQYPVTTFPYIVKILDAMGVLQNSVNYDDGYYFDYVAGLNLGTSTRSFIVDYGLTHGVIVQSLLAAFYTSSAHYFFIKKIYGGVFLALVPLMMHIVLNYYSDPIFILTIFLLLVTKIRNNEKSNY